MKTTMITSLMMIFALAVGSALADDMWSETPDLTEIDLTASGTNEPIKLNNRKPAIDMWAETPDLSKRIETYDVYLEELSVNNGEIDPRMYAETPDLSAIAASEKTSPNDKVDFKISRR